MATKLQYGITIRAVSDGSYHPTYQYGTSAWIIKTQNNDRTIIGDNAVPGDAKPQFNHRSEICGFIGAIHNINNICITYNVHEVSEELGCNGLEAYKMVTRYAYSLYNKLPNYALSSNHHQYIKAIPLLWKFCHVKGHQDNGDTYNNIDEWVQINI